MKKLPKYLSTVPIIAVIWGAFFVPYAYAVTVYQQFSDSSISLELPPGGVILASFTVSNSYDPVPAELQLVANVPVGTGCVLNLFTVYVSTSTTFSALGSDRIVDFRPRNSPDGGCIPDDAQDHFSVATTTSTGYSGVTYEPGQTYYIWGQSAVADIFVTTNLSQDFYYGYLTAGGFNVTLPILPGLPGYTDYGIATTSQQVYCYGNFSTSTGLLDSIGQSISLGICNVGVFLFVPSNSVVNNFFLTASSSAERIPISYFYDFRNAIISQVATTAATVPTYSVNLQALGLGSSTPLGNVLPALTILSTSTIDTFLPAGMRTTLINLASYAIWVFTAFTLYSIGRRELAPKS